MDSNNILNLQHQIKENSDDLQNYLLDLESWEKEMKKKEEELKLIHTKLEEEIPPIRNSLYRSKKKSRHKKQKDKTPASDKTHSKTIDYQTWEIFDADAELKKIDEEAKQSSASENSENEDEFCVQKRKQVAILHKDKGNDFFKNRNYDAAINSYTAGLQLDPENPLLAANRAMAFLKKEQYQAAENDCTLCLTFDPTYVKAYLRRGTARKKLNKLPLAKADFLKALEFEPENKQAQAELKKLPEVPSTEATDISENEVVKSQELWSQFLGNKAVKHTGESIQEVKETELPGEENSCIFPDSYSVPLGKNSSSLNDLESKTQVPILELDEVNYVDTIENKVNSLKVSTSTSQLEEAPVNTVPEPPLPPVPSTSFQFLTDWNEISSFPDLQYKYLKQFPPNQFPILFKHYMEPAIFPKILETLSASFIENGDDIFDYMKYLTSVGRFNTMIMFLSGKEENDLKKLLKYLKSSKREESEISAVLNKYGA